MAEVDPDHLTRWAAQQAVGDDRFRGIMVRELRDLGYVIQKPKQTADYLRRYAFDPAALIDVGVDTGTPELYRLFPRVPIIMVDPLESTAEIASRLSERRPIHHFACCAGAETGEITFYRGLQNPSMSGVERRSHLTREKFGDFEEASVEIRTLDSIIEETELLGPFFLKIDVEGAEHEVLRGSSSTLAQTCGVLVEVSVRQRFSKTELAASVIAILHDAGFEIADILRTSAYPPLVLDILFVPAGHHSLKKVPTAPAI